MPSIAPRGSAEGGACFPRAPQGSARGYCQSPKRLQGGRTPGGNRTGPAQAPNGWAAMAEARRQEAWQHTGWLSAMIANTGRDPQKWPRPFAPDDVNPMGGQRDRKARGIVMNVTQKNSSVLGMPFLGGRATAPAGNPR